ncbi:hypothetical protein D8M04_18035 [Oceanobacillus piezotolerans]|uniref:Zinc chelation protein SecC n=2 Tax=Oceanobacillus piezotolerans TaxID=2448030 RepID=A0A498D6Q0_9BACI|nr:hypothetical protein D8M04_18035 [Oceanobacillus piezotolerans]
MSNAFKALSENKEKKEKQQKKYWSEIKIPFTLQEGLSNYTKSELDGIRKSLKVKNASQLKKADLIALLHDKISNHFDIAFWDNERFKLLIHIAESGGQIPAPNLEDKQIVYFRSSGLIYTGTFEGKHILAVPDDLIQQILSLKNNLNARAIINRNTEWINLTQGILYYYGALSSTQLADMLKKHTKDHIDSADLEAVMQDASAYRNRISINDDFYSNIRVLDSKKVIQEHQRRENVAFYPFTKQQIINAGEPGFVDRNPSYQQLIDFLTQNFNMNKSEADEIAEECVIAIKNGDSANDVLAYLSNLLEFGTMEIIQALMSKIVDLMSHTRGWTLKGYTSAQLSGETNKQIQPMPTSTTKKKVKIGRNEPCPCGSGKKYKKCCGR